MISNRTLLQLQPDIIVAKLSRNEASPNALIPGNPSRVYHPDPSSDDQMTRPAKSSMVSKQARVNNGRPWTVSSLFGTIKYSRRCYSTIQKRTTDGIRSKEERAEIVMEYCGPSWAVNRIWRIQAVKSRSGWTFCPRTYNVVPRDSLVFQYIRDDNIKGLQELFSRREASPFDLIEKNNTTLHVCFISCTVQKYLGAKCTR